MIFVLYILNNLSDFEHVGSTPVHDFVETYSKKQQQRFYIVFVFSFVGSI